MTDAIIAGLMQYRQTMLDELYAIRERAKRLLTDVAVIEGAIKVLGPAERLEAAREIDLAGIESKAAKDCSERAGGTSWRYGGTIYP